MASTLDHTALDEIRFRTRTGILAYRPETARFVVRDDEIHVLAGGPTSGRLSLVVGPQEIEMFVERCEQVGKSDFEIRLVRASPGPSLVTLLGG